MRRIISASSSTYSNADNGVAGLSATPALHAQTPDFGERALQMPGGLGVHDQHVGTRGLKIRKDSFGLHDHQMHIKKQAAALAQLPDDVLPEGNVRHKPPVHDIPVHPPETGGLQSRKLRRKVAHVSGKKGRRKNHRSLPCRFKTLPSQQCLQGHQFAFHMAEHVFRACLGPFRPRTRRIPG